MAGEAGRGLRNKQLLVLTALAAVMSVLVATGVWNPFPYIGHQIGAWWERMTALAKPMPDWTVRADGEPKVAAVMQGQVIVASRGYVAAYGTGSGKRNWRHQVQFALPAGDVVVVRFRAQNQDSDRGYSVLDPVSGAAKWSDRDAQAVWAYRDGTLDLTCPDPGACQLRRRAYADGAVMWRVTLPEPARAIRGANPEVAGTRDPAEWFAAAAAGNPGPMPRVLGIVQDGQIYVIDTFWGRYVREVSPPDRQTRIALAGDRMLLVNAKPSESGCAYWIEALEYQSGESRWRRDGYDVDTASGAGCEQRRAPVAAGGLVLVTGTDGRERLIQVRQAQEKWIGVPGERVLATDGDLAAVAGADRRTIRFLDLQRTGQSSVWTYTGGLDAEAAITPDSVFVRDADKRTLTVRDRLGLSRSKLSIKTSRAMIGYGPTGIILVSGRRIAYVSFGSHAGT